MKLDFNGGREQIDPAPIDINKVCQTAIKAVELVINDSEDYSMQIALSLFNQLTNDERIALQTILKSASPEGTRKTYYSCFKDHCTLEREWTRNQ